MTTDYSEQEHAKEIVGTEMKNDGMRPPLRVVTIAPRVANRGYWVSKYQEAGNRSEYARQGSYLVFLVGMLPRRNLTR